MKYFSSSTTKTDIKLNKLFTISHSAYVAQRKNCINLNRKKKKYFKIDYVRNYWRIYSQKCGIHGIRYLTEDDLHWSERLTWFVLVAVTTFTAIYVSFLLSQRYNTSLLSTVVESTYYHISEIPYPGVSICNFNRINYKKVNAAIERFIPNASNYTKISFQLLLEKFETLDFGSFDELSPVADRNLTTLDKLNITAVWEFVMHSCEELFVECWWRIRYINCCDYFTLQKSEYGLCYSFNSATSKGTPFVNRSAENWPWRVSSYGEWSGLWIELNIMIDTKLASSIHPSGAMAMIHHPFEWPTIGNFIPAGSTTSIAIKPTAFYTSPDVRRFTPDQRQCIYEEETIDHSVMTLPGLPYLRPNCIARCRQKYMMKYCNCIIDVYYAEGDFPPCNATGMICMSYYNDIFNNEKPLEKNIFFDPNETGLSCPCLQECSRIEYGIEVQPNLNTDGNKENVALNIFFKTQTMLRYRKDVMFGWLDLLVAFGGVAGLCLGASLLSLVEIAYYLTMGLFWEIKRSKYNNLSGKPKPSTKSKILHLNKFQIILKKIKN